MTVRIRRPSPATVIASAALFVAAGGPAEAARMIDGGKIKRGTVGSRQVKDRSLSVRDLSRGTYRRLRAVPARSVGAAQLAPGAVGPAALALNGISGANVVDGGLRAEDLARDAVTATGLARNAVRRRHIVSGAVAADEVATGAVGSSEVADGSLGGADLAAFRGTFVWDVPPLTVGTCASTIQPVSPAAAGGPAPSVADDLVLVAPEAGRWAPELTLSAVARDAGSIEVSACNVGGSEVAPIDPAVDVTFRYLALSG